MFRNYVVAAWRCASRDCLYTCLNVLGLAIGSAAIILIWLFVRDELSYNSFLPGYRDAYIVKLTVAETGQRPMTTEGTPERLAAELRLDFPQIAAMTRTKTQSVGLRQGNVEAVENIMWVDADFFSVLGYRLLRGDPASALAQPDSIVLTRGMAMKYFGGLDCVGQTMQVDHLHTVRVTAVAEDPPTNATQRFLALLSGKSAWGKLAIADATPPVPGQLSLSGETFLRLRAGTPPAELAARFPAFIRAHYTDPDEPGTLFDAMFLHSMADVHLHPINPDTNEPELRMQTLQAVAATGLLILLLAGIDFVNLMSARSTRRAVEVGVRKSLGALRSQLLAQFMGESLAYALSGLILGMALAALVLPTLNAFLERQISFDVLQQPDLAVVPLAMAVLFGLAAGLYPAVILSRFRPAQVLKGRAGTSLGGVRLRAGLVVFQFAVTTVVLIATIVIHSQLSYATSRALGFDKNLLLTIDLNGLPGSITSNGLSKRDAAPLEALRTRLAAVPGVQAMVATFTLPPWYNFIRLDYARPEHSIGQTVNLTMQPVDYGYFGVYRVPLLAGRDFSRDFADDRVAANDKSNLSAAVINERALKLLGFANPAEAVGQEIRSTDPTMPRRQRIIGVSPDFPLESVRDPVPPSIFIVDPDLFNVLTVRLSRAHLTDTLQGIDAVWRESVPGRPINRTFLDDRIAVLYRDVAHESQLFTTFAGFAAAIGCLGLLGLSAYTAERRTKEIGVRKALGASAADVTGLLVWQFIRPVLMANVLAWPAAWWIMRSWLDGFAYRIDLGPVPFLLAGMAALTVAVATTAFNAVHAARRRPATALLYE